MTPLINLQNKLVDQGIDLTVITNPQLIDYFVGYHSDPMERILALFVSPSQSILFVPYLDAADVKASVNCPVISYKDEENPWQVIGDKVLSQFKATQTIGLDYASHTLDKYFELKSLLTHSEFTDTTPLFNQLRLIKTQEEKSLLIEAGRLADKALQVGIEALKVGVSEQAVVAKIEYEMKKQGVSNMSFPTMVLFGDHAGSPHGEPGDRKLKANEFVLFDLGVLYNGYASDMTRTVFFGDSQHMSESHKKVYDTVLKAQETAQSQARPGMTAADLDNIARKIIQDAGYGDYFIHRLGHGIGQTAHEFPSISSANHDQLIAGMAFSIEPGIYIPGDVGVRIEDCLFLEKDGAVSFTNFPKSLQFVKAN